MILAIHEVHEERRGVAVVMVTRTVFWQYIRVPVHYHVA